MRACRPRASGSSAALDQLLESLQRLVGLRARGPHDRAPCHLAERAARERVLVRVGEVGAAVVRGEVVCNLRLRAERALALPHGLVRAVGALDLPLQLELLPGHATALHQLRPLREVTGRRLEQLLLDRHPVAEAVGVHQLRVDVLGRCIDVKLAFQLGHRAVSSSSRSHSRSACSTARSNGWPSMPSYTSRAFASVRGSRSCSRLSMNGRTSSTGWPTIPATTALAVGVWETPSRIGMRPTPITSPIRSIIAP